MLPRSPLFARARLILARLFQSGLPPSGDSPADPYARVRVPRHSGPSGRSAAVAVAEPEEAPQTVIARGSIRRS